MCTLQNQNFCKDQWMSSKSCLHQSLIHLPTWLIHAKKYPSGGSGSMFRLWWTQMEYLEPIQHFKIHGMFQNCGRIETSQFYHHFET